MTLSDSINRMIEMALVGAKITSASPGHVNTVFLLEEMDHSDIENDIRSIVEEEINATETETLKTTDVLTPNNGESSETQKDVDSLQQTFENLKDSPFGTLTDLTREQANNLSVFSKDPFAFMLKRFFKKFTRGAGVIALATIIFAAVQVIISELMKPGRLLDVRFRRIASNEFFLFNSREEQAELRQGFRTVTITTLPFLRGAEARGQISGNLYNPTATPMNRLDPRRVEPVRMSVQTGGRGSKFANRRNSRFG